MAGIIQITVAMNNEQILSICILIVFQVLEMEQSGNPHPLAQFLKTSTNTAREGQFQSFKAKKIKIIYSKSTDTLFQNASHNKSPK